MSSSSEEQIDLGTGRALMVDVALVPVVGGTTGTGTASGVSDAAG